MVTAVRRRYHRFIYTEGIEMQVNISAEAAKMVLGEYGYFVGAQACHVGAFAGHTAASGLRFLADILDTGADYLEKKGNDWDTASKAIELIRSGAVDMAQLQQIAAGNTVNATKKATPKKTQEEVKKDPVKQTEVVSEETYTPEELAEMLV